MHDLSDSDRDNFRRGVAQPGSAPALGAGSRRFKSSRPDQSLLQNRVKMRKAVKIPTHQNSNHDELKLPLLSQIGKKPSI